MTTKADISCTGTMKAVALEPALAAFFGVSSDDLTTMSVDVEFLTHNTWMYDFPGVDQRITLTKVNGIDIDYDVPVTNQEGRVDLWGTVEDEAPTINIMIGVERFQISDISKA